MIQQTERQDSMDEIIAFIDKWKVNKGVLAEKLGIDVSHFSKKMNLREHKKGWLYKFTPAQKDKLLTIFKDMGKEFLDISEK